MLQDQPTPVARARFIEAMRQVASSVTVVTTDGCAGRYGATVSAFSSVSADPPTLLVCLHAESRIAQRVTENGNFCVNVLPEGSGALADRFAGRHDGWIADRFSGVDCPGADGIAPRIEGATGFHCVVENAIVSGSHLIVIGHVRDVICARAMPLTYRDGCYHRVVPQGDPISTSAN